MKKDLVVGAISGYSFAQVSAWLLSLDRTGFRGERVALVANGGSSLVDELSARGVRVVTSDSDGGSEGYRYPKIGFTDADMSVERFLLLSRFLSRLSADDHRYTIAVDVRDAVFQLDPSEWLSRNLGDKSLVVSSEGLTYADEDWNRKSMNDAFGPDIFSRMAERLVFNCGAIAGDTATVRDLGLAIHLLCEGRNVQYADQAALNVLLSLEPYRSRTLFDHGDLAWNCPANTMVDTGHTPAWQSKYRGVTPVLDGDTVRAPNGRTFCIVHQYDRIPLWNERLAARYRLAPAPHARAPVAVAPGRSPLVSVVIIFFNAARFLAEAIDSVFAQTYGAWELLLVDDGSSDGSGEIARSYARRHADRVRCLEHARRENRGMSASRNLGIRNARGKYVALLDADDVWLPAKLERQVAILESHEGAAMVYGATQYWKSWDQSGADYVPALGLPSNRVYAPPSLVTRLHPLGQAPTPCPSDLFFRRDLAERVGGFEESFAGVNQMFEDIAFLSKVFLRESVYVAGETWDRYRLHPHSCVATVTAGGHAPKVERFYLEWLAQYLDRHAITDATVRDALDLALASHTLERHPLRSRLAPIAYRLSGGTWRLGETARPLSTTRSRPEGPPRLEGHHDSTDASIVWGWAWDAASPGNPVDVDVYDGRRRVATLRANQYRADLERAGKGDGRHGFTWRIPQWLRDGRPHTLTLKFAGTDQPLTSTPGVFRSELQLLRDLQRLLVETRGAVRRALRPPPGTVELGDLDTTVPISRAFGFDRGRPIDRYYIEAFLRLRAGDVHGRVMEIGDDTYTREFGGSRVTKSDVVNVLAGDPRTTIVADLSRGDGLPEDAFDCILFTQTLQLIYDVRAAVEALHRALKPGGVLLATFPGISKTSDVLWGDYWCWNLTARSARTLFGEVFRDGQVMLTPHGNVLAAVAFLHGLAVEEVRREDLDVHDPGYEVVFTVRARKAGPEKR